MDKAAELKKLYQKIIHCDCCQKVIPSKVRRQVLENTLSSEIVLMAQAPAETGVRISGVHWNKENGTLTAGGSFLDKHLALIKYSVNLKNNEYVRPYTTNVLQCWTGRERKGKGERDRYPKDKELTFCSCWWKKELEIICPKVIVFLGAPAIECFAQVIGKEWKLAERLKHQGEIIIIDDMELKGFFLPHPTSSYKEKDVPNPRKKSQIYHDVFIQINKYLSS